VYAKRTRSTIRAAGAALALVAGASLGGCINLAKNNYFLPGGVDTRSPVAGQVQAAQHAPGPMPKFTQIPPMPTDIRPMSAWRASVGEVKAQKRQVDAAARTYPFALHDTEAFAQAARSRIPPNQAAAPTDDATKAAEDYAASVRGRATPPPQPN
jgi:hypothetical protein